MTPPGLKGKLYTFFRVPRILIKDVALFAQDWDTNTHFDLFQDDWAACYVFLNPPFSQTGIAVVQALIKFYQGANIIMIVPTVVKESVWYNTYCHPVVIDITDCFVKFLYGPNENKKLVSVIAFIQPN